MVIGWCPERKRRAHLTQTLRVCRAVRGRCPRHPWQGPRAPAPRVSAALAASEGRSSSSSSSLAKCCDPASWRSFT